MSITSRACMTVWYDVSPPTYTSNSSCLTRHRLHTCPTLNCVNQVKKEWYDPVQHNSFAIPFISLIFMAWMSSMWSGDPTGKIAMVLFWLGAIPLSSITIYTIARFVVGRVHTSSLFNAKPRASTYGRCMVAFRGRSTRARTKA